MQYLRKIIHIDMDAFFASVEQHDNPTLKGQPLVVGGQPGGRGVVAACSYEARAYGVHSAMASFKALKLCPQAIFVPPRKGRYKEISQQIMSIFESYTPTVEQISVDEAFLDVTKHLPENGSATHLAAKICADIYNQTGLTASAGISYNKFLAKIASDMNKPAGMYTITPKDAVTFIERLPVGKFYGVGKVTEQKMHELGIKTGADLKRLSKERLKNRFGKAGLFFYHIVRGEDNRPVQPYREKKSIGTETTLSTDTFDLDEIKEIFHHLCGDVGMVLKRQNIRAKTLIVKIRFQDFSTITRSLTLQKELENADDILDALPLVLKSCSFVGKYVRLLGVTVGKLQAEEGGPRPLLLPFPKNKSNSSFDTYFSEQKKMYSHSLSNITDI